MVVGDAHVFPGFLTSVLTQLFFPKPQTTFLTCFCRGERRKNAEKKSRLNWGSNSQPPGHKSDTLTTELSGRVNQLKLSLKIMDNPATAPCYRVSTWSDLYICHQKAITL